MKQKHEFKSIVAETLLIPLYMRAKESRRGGQSGIRLLPIRRGKAERSGMRGARMVFRPCRAAVC